MFTTSFDITNVPCLTSEISRESQPTLATLMQNIPGMAYRCRNDRARTLEFVSEGCYNLTAYHPHELIGKDKVSYAEIIHPQDRELVWKEVQAACSAGQNFQLAYRITTADLEEKWVWEQGRGVFSDEGELLALEGLIIDITSRKRAEEEIKLLQTLTQAIADAEDFNESLGVAIRKVCETTGWDFGEAWIPHPNGTVLECTPAWYSSTPALEAFRRQSVSLTFAPSVGLPGKVWSSQQPEWIPDVSDATKASFFRCEIAKDCGLRAGFGVPIVTENRVLAVLTFFMFESRQRDKRLVELVSAVAAQLGTVLQHKHAQAALQESQRRLSSLIDSLPGLVFSCANDPQWSMTYVSEGCLQLTGYHSEELIGNRAGSYDAITHPEDLPKVLEVIETSVARKQPYVVEYRIRTKFGSEKWVWEKGNGVFDSGGQLRCLEGFITDITELKRAEEERSELIVSLREAEAKYRSIFENAIEGIFQTTPDGHYISANPSLARIYGYGCPAELMARLTDIEHQLYVEPNRRAEFISLLQEHHAVSEFESQVYRQDGSIIWISENARAVRDATGALLYYEGRVEDITERKRAKEQLLHHAFYDTLTGLPNRALFMERLQRAIERAKSSDRYLLAVLFIDLDRFKVVNDSLGHLVGDQLLVAIARRLEACVRSQDTVARLGGDEFTILLENIENIHNATAVAERIHAALAGCIYLDGHEVFTAASIGIVLNGSKDNTSPSTPTAGELPHEQNSQLFYDRPEDLLRDADTALYRAKTLGRGRHEVFDMTMHQSAVALLQLEIDLRHALERGEFQIHYQPVVSLSKGSITGFEALLRWQHPIKGLIPPSEFISVAEETALIIPMGWWMLREACCQLRSWQLAFPGRCLTITVNLSCRQFSQPNLLEQIDQILHETELDGCSLKLEISETCLLKNAERAAACLLELKKRQIEVCIDDFGRGNCSLSFMHQLPIKGLQIDRSFVSQMGVDEGEGQLEGDLALQIVRTMVTLAHNLGIEAIAEGVENAQQLKQLRSLDCEYAQGYFFSHPLDAIAAEALMAKEMQW